MIRFSAMTEADIPLGMRLKAQAGWNQVEADWRRFLHLQPDGCFVAQWNGRDVGTTTTCIFGSVGWIAMVLVDSDYRHRGIGTRLVEHALRFLDDRRVAAARLDATALGRPVYEKLGFVAQYELIRMEGVLTAVTDQLAAPSPDDPLTRSTVAATQSAASPLPICLPAGLDDLDVIGRWDRRATGTQRDKLLARLLAEPGSRAYLTGDEATSGGYVISRSGARAAQLGPVAASSPAAGRALLDRAAADWTGQRIYVDVPSDNRAAVQWAEVRGLVCQRSFTRMVRGRCEPDDTEWLWASSGPEKG
jgi:GNAT superfamily N-acetyltransferase